MQSGAACRDGQVADLAAADVGVERLGQSGEGGAEVLVVRRGVRSGAVELPEIGLYVSHDRLEFDHRMGPRWSAATAAALVRLLGVLRGLDADARVWDCTGAPRREQANPAFERAVLRYLTAVSALPG